MDVFVYGSHGMGVDAIMDFTQGEDVISLQGLGLGWGDLTFTNVSGGVLITWGVGNEGIFLNGITAGQLQGGDFAL